MEVHGTVNEYEEFHSILSVIAPDHRRIRMDGTHDR